MATDEKYYFDEQEAEDAVAFFEHYLVHTKGQFGGKPFLLEPWQRTIIRDVFGWKRKSDGTRRYRTVYIEVPRKNGKSNLASGVALYLLLADGEYGAEVYSAAADREQAGIVYDIAKNMVEASPALSERCEPLKKSIWVQATLSKYQAISHEAGTKWGLNPSGIIIDELHAHKTRDLYDTLTTAVGARAQPLTWIITTAGHDRTSIGWEIHEKALRVLDGREVDETFYPVVYGATLDDDWHDEAVWAKANPNLGVAFSIEFLRKEYQDAVRMPGRQNVFRRMYLNQWVEQAVRWMDVDEWDACGDPEIQLEAMAGAKCYAGLDLSSTKDLTALVLLFPPEQEGEQWIAIPRFYMPADRVRGRVEDSSVPYDQWVAEGHIQTIPGDVVNYDLIRKDINDLGLKVKIKEVALDRWNATHLITQLNDDGLKAEPYSQSIAAMSGPMRELERLIIAREIEHDASPVMRWMMGNVAPKEDADGRIKPDRSRSADKIDGVVALVMALGRAMIESEGYTPPSKYEDEGLFFV